MSHLNRHQPISDRRSAELRRILENRRRDLSAALQQRVRQAGTPDSLGSDTVLDSAEAAEADVQDDLRISLIQLQAEMLERVEQALIRLDSGNFGTCVDCGEGIAERRLQALPFALRCTACEQERENAARASRNAPKFGSVYDAFGTP